MIRRIVRALAVTGCVVLPALLVCAGWYLGRAGTPSQLAVDERNAQIDTLFGRVDMLRAVIDSHQSDRRDYTERWRVAVADRDSALAEVAYLVGLVDDLIVPMVCVRAIMTMPPPAGGGIPEQLVTVPMRFCASEVTVELHPDFRMEGE
jgi:hypothetical protein